MDGTTGGRCCGILLVTGKRIYHHTTQDYFFQSSMPVTSSHVKTPEVTDMKMCRWACRQTLIYNERKYNIRERLKVENNTERCRKPRPGWFGKTKNTSKETLELVPTGRRKRGRPKQRWMDCVNRDTRAIGTTQYEVHDRTGWRRIVSAAATPQLSGSA